jgi:sulfane dehydrogenase subunit SoxC
MNRQRRNFLAAATTAAALTSCEKPAAKQAAPSMLGADVRPYGERSTFETAARAHGTVNLKTASSRTPLDETYGAITPNGLFFERHHAGVPQLDPAKHELLIHGMVDHELIFTLADLKRLPSVSRVHFLECAGNSGSEWQGSAERAQATAGLASCAEWTGVSLKTLLTEAGLQANASWAVAEGGDACLMARSVPLTKLLDDALIAYAQNGEALRPEQGYPMRLLLPGFEGNMSVKWLRRLHVTAEPMHSREETSHYTDLMADGKARQYSFEMDAKSLVLRPSGGHKIAQGFHEVTGLAWSGRGRITSVEVSADGGKSWRKAELQEPVLPKAFTRFRLPWNWNGAETTLQSRCTDDTGYVQPTRDELIAARGANSQYHYNGIKTWRIAADGAVTNG